MAERNDVLHITLKIGMRQFPMSVKRADEYYYREAEKLINERHQYYAGRYPGQENDTYLMMTLLDIAVRFKRAETSADNAPMVNALESLVADIDRALS